jgi:hypothetical protein
MLRWQFQPDEAFAAILESSLSTSIEWLSDHLAGTIAEAEVFSLFGTQLWELFDTQQLLTELQKLLVAHRSAKLYMPTDYHFLILHEVLQLQINHHNDQVASGGQPLAFGSVLLGHVDFDFVSGHFWDEDFLFDPTMMSGLSEEDKAAMGFNKETFALVQGLKHHPKELELNEVNADTESPQNHYKRGECYPHDEEQQE